MAQIITYKIDVISEKYQFNIVRCDEMEKLIEYLQESGMIIINSELILKEELILFLLLKTAMPQVTILNIALDNSNYTPAFLNVKTDDLDEYFSAQLCKTFKIQNKKKLVLDIQKIALNVLA